MRNLILVLLVALASACSHPHAPLVPVADAGPSPLVISGAASQVSVAPSIDSQPLFSASVEPRNLVCERIKLINDKAECTPELSDVGEGHVYTARVKYTAKTKDGGDVTLMQVCGLAVGQWSMVCGDLLQSAPPVKGGKK